jgi:hypothetical protein
VDELRFAGYFFGNAVGEEDVDCGFEEAVYAGFPDGGAIGLFVQSNQHTIRFK